MNIKAIQAIPFGEFAEKSRVRWKVIVREPVIDGERLLTADFLRNTACTAYQREDASFRIVCGKKSREVKGITAEGRVSDGVLKAFYRYRGEYILISEREEKAIARFLGKESKDGSNHQIEWLARWVYRTKEEMKKRERQKRGELMDEDYRLCPEALPEGLADHIRREVLPKDNTLVYKKGNVRGRCYLCGETVQAWNRRFTQGSIVTCPNCGRQVVCALEGSEAYRANYVDNIVIAQKGTDGETVFFRQFQLRRDPSARWENIGDFLRETVRYAIRKDKTAKWQKESKDNYYMRTERYDLEQWTRWQDNRIYDGGYYFCPVGIEEALRGTVMQYADLRGYLDDAGRNKNTIYFLEYHAKYPVIEFLWKAGYHRLVHDRIFGTNKENRNAILWQRKKLKECFRFPLRLLKLLPPEDWTLNRIHTLNRLWAKKGEAMREADARAILQCGFNIEFVERALPYASAEKILRYLDKQTEKRQADFVKQHSWDTLPKTANIAMEYRDYLRECDQLDIDLTDKAVLFPKDLQAAHQRTMAQVKFEQNKADQKKFQKAVDALEKFAWQQDGLLIRPARKQKELAEEGTALHHCVGGYIQRMAKGETAIFFIRRIEEPDKPYFTLELQKQQVIQCRTENNRSYEQFPEIKAFVDRWLEKIVAKGGNQQKKRKKQKEAAA